MRQFVSRLTAVILTITFLFGTVPFEQATVFAVPEITESYGSGADKNSVSDALEQIGEKNADTLEHAYNPSAAVEEYQKITPSEEDMDTTTLLVKLDANKAPALDSVPKAFADLGAVDMTVTLKVTNAESMELVHASSPYIWVRVSLDEGVSSLEVAQDFQNISYVLSVEYNYLRKGDGSAAESSNTLPNPSKNPLMKDQWYLNSKSVRNAWNYIDNNNLRENLENIVVAVIDTGVDYTHPNLVNSMWINEDEIPGDGIDNDNNGYVDDYYGCSTIGSTFDHNGDPMDEMGHGTHVAGIIAATKDQMGVIGLAYGVKIMAIKCGSYYFNDADLVEAVNYAVENGADVINMSLGSYSRSAMLEDALAIAYSHAVLVAAAGNDGLDIVLHNAPLYPAQYNFVLGVMALDTDGSLAYFSNTDVFRRNSREYECSAPGVSMLSTLPDGRYASWSGTSMATPYVSAVAAILRAKFNDKSQYSTRFIMGQIVGTATDCGGTAVDVYKALTEVPVPELSTYDFYIFDDPAYSEKNNGDGIIDAGETIGLGVLIRNHWGQARNTSVKLVCQSGVVLSPYVTWIKDTVEYHDVGTFNTSSNGFIYDDDGVIIGITDPFLFKVDEKTPNDSYLYFQATMDCDDDAGRHYSFGGSFTAQVRRGVELPRLIDHDMTLKSDTYYILMGSTLIDYGVTLTIEPGTQIQFWGDFSKELYAGQDVAELIVDGELIAVGTADNPIQIFPSTSMPDMKIDIRTRSPRAKATLQYCKIANPTISVTTIDHCYFYQHMFDCMGRMEKAIDGIWYHYTETPFVSAQTISNSIFYELGYQFYGQDYRLRVSGKLYGNLFDSCGLSFDTWSVSEYKDNTFLKNYRLVESQYGDRSYLVSDFSIRSQYGKNNVLNVFCPVKNPETGSTYFVLTTPSLTVAESFAQSLGGHVVRMETQSEKAFIEEYIRRYLIYNEKIENGGYGRAGFNNILVGYYEDAFGQLQMVGKGTESSYLKRVKNNNIPGYSCWYNVHEDDIELVMYESGFWADEYSVFFSENPSVVDSNYGIIIEIPGEVSPLSISFENDVVTIPSNTVNYKLSTVVYPNVPGARLLWSSDDPSVASVDENGSITANSIGVCHITVRIDGTDITGEAVIIVKQYYAPTGISDSETNLFFNEYGATKKLTPVVTPAEASPIIDFTSSDTSVVVVNSVGVITVLGSGSAEITATIRGTEFKVVYNIDAVIPPDTLEISNEFITLSLDDNSRKQVGYTFTPITATVGRVLYSISDERIAKIDENGVLTPVSEGTASVSVFFPDINKKLNAKVLVVAESDSVKIVNASNASFSGGAFFSAADGTTYYVGGRNFIGFERLPQNLNLKAKQANLRNWWNEEIVYIDLEDTLYIKNVYSAEKGTLIDKDVSQIVTYNENQFFYIKIDGSVGFAYYTDADGWAKIRIDALENIRDGYLSGSPVFLDEYGKLYTLKLSYEQTEEEIIWTIICIESDINEKFVAISHCDNRVLSEDGKVWYIGLDEENERMNIWQQDDISVGNQTAYSIDFRDVAEFIIYQGNGNDYIVLMNDGTVYYYGSRRTSESDFLCFNSLLPSTTTRDMYALDLGGTVRTMGRGYFVMSDGTVKSYLTYDNDILGNGKTHEQNRRLTRPVTVQFGCVNDGVSMDVTGISVKAGGDTTEFAPETTDLGTLPQDFTITVSTLKYITQITERSIYFNDALGNKTAAVVTDGMFGNQITITPAKPLREGYYYTLYLNTGAIRDEYANLNNQYSVSFTMEGTASYDVPVTGIEGGATLQLDHNETAKLTVNVLPADASMKNVIWSSSDERVATVSDRGSVTGNYNGTAIITATTIDGGFTAEFTVKVSVSPLSMSTDKDYVVLKKGEKSTPVAIVPDPYYAEVGEITYFSSDTSIATVDANGVITAVGAGSTIINVSVSNCEKPMMIFVNVVEDTESITIKSMTNKDRTSYLPFFIAEDNTVWFISSEYENNQGAQYLPRKTDFKAKVVSSNNCYGRIFYIDPNNTLYYRGSIAGESEKVATDVKNVMCQDNYVFFIKNDGSVYHYNTETGKIVKCTALTGVVDMTVGDYNGAFFMFLSSDGTVRTIKLRALENGFSTSDIVKLTLNEKIVSMNSRRILAESGKQYSVYSENWESEKADHAGEECWACEDYYAANKERITKTVMFDNYSGGAMFLLDDGTVIFATQHDGVSSSCRLVSGYDNIYEIIGLSGRAVDICAYYILMEDGTVQSITYDDPVLLGNNNRNRKRYTHPVTAWIGAEADIYSPELLSVSSVSGGVSTASGLNELNTDIPVDASFEFSFSEYLYNLNESVSLMDYRGRSYAVNVTLKNGTLTVVPTEPLDEGNLYYLSISDGTATDFYENPTPYIEFSFTTAGELHFDVPVEEISANMGTVTIVYGEKTQLTYTITPENASVQRVFWTTSDATVASVDESGVVTGGRNGTATVTATTLDGSHSCSFTVRVKTPAESFELSQKFMLLDTKTNKTAALTANVKPEILSDGQQFSWSSSDPSVVTVDNNGNITAKSIGVTTVVCTCDGVDQTAQCVVSVVSDTNDAKVTKVFSRTDQAFIYATETGLWISNGSHTIPKKVDVTDVKYAVLTSDYMLAVLHNDGLFEMVDVDSGYAEAICDDVEMLAAANERVILLKNGNLYGYFLGEPGPSLLDWVDGAVQITPCWFENYYFFVLDYNGIVWRIDMWGNVSPWYNDEVIVDITYGGGTYMKTESGSFYPISNPGLTYVKDVNTYAGRIVEIAHLRNDWTVFTLDDGTSYCAIYRDWGVDGKLNPERIEDNAFVNATIYRIDVGGTIISAGFDWILTSDGYARMSVTGGYGYYGTGEWGYGFPITPYFTETDADLNNLSISSAKVGDAEISPDETYTVPASDTITISFELPVSDRGKLALTSIKDSTGKVYKRSIEVTGKQIIITMQEQLKAGETYTLKIFNESVIDIFNHVNGYNIVYEFSVTGAATAAYTADASSKYPTTDFSPDYSEKELGNLAKTFYKDELMKYISEHSVNTGNAFLNAYPNPDATAWMELKADWDYTSYADLTGNFWGTTKTDLIDRIITDVKDSFNYAEILYQPLLEQASENAFPFVTSIIVRDSEGNITTSVGIEEITVEVYFNRNMDMSVKPTVTFGSDYPYGDFTVDGEWTDARTWVGKAKIYAVTGSGTQYFKVRGAVAENDPWLKTGNDYERFVFVIATSGAKSMSMQANGGDGYIELEWTQDDYDTLAGYNVYRSTVLDGTYQKINKSVVSPDTTYFIDKDVEDGVKYFYYFTVVKTDLTESEPSGKSDAASKDMTPPTITHTAVGTAPENSAVPITAYVRDNTRVSQVMLYYRTKGAADFSSIEMYPNALEASKYTATIPAGAMTSAGADYYIMASDGNNEAYCGSADKPYSISTYKLYTITVSVNDGGTITLSQQKAKEGATVRVNVNPADGCALLIGSLKYTYGGRTYNINDESFIMPAENVTITATFVQKSEYQPGDVNRDGAVDSGDAVLILKYDARLIEFTDEQLVLADINEDGRINAYDATLVLEKDVGIS